LSLDGAEHHRQRRLVSKAFTPKAAARLRSTCADVITELTNRHADAGRCDVVAAIANQYPIPIICALLGTPSEDWHLFSDWADDIFKFFDWNIANDAPDIMRAWKELEAYLDDMVSLRHHALTDDLLSDMMRAEMDGDRLTHDELLMLTATLLMAGTDTTRNQLAAAVQVFCDHPDQWALLAEHAEFAPEAVEEVMRCSPVIFTAMRLAQQDVKLAGVTISEGTLVIANTAAANRDPAVYDEPDRLRHHSRRRSGHADLRRRHPLLPGRAPNENRTRRSADDNGAPHAQHPPRRSCPVEADDRHQRSS
jgi:cytochrome P450